MKLFQSNEYKSVAIKNNYNIIEFLLKENIEFIIIAHTNVIEFNPPIPKEVIEFDEIVRFDIAGYSFESATLNRDSLIFEAGFGAQNYGSILTIPLEAIYQIAVGETLLSINYYKPKKINSMEILLNNPENKKLLKKIKK